MERNIQRGRKCPGFHPFCRSCLFIGWWYCWGSRLLSFSISLLPFRICRLVVHRELPLRHLFPLRDAAPLGMMPLQRGGIEASGFSLAFRQPAGTGCARPGAASASAAACEDAPTFRQRLERVAPLMEPGRYHCPAFERGRGETMLREAGSAKGERERKEGRKEGPR